MTNNTKKLLTAVVGTLMALTIIVTLVYTFCLYSSHIKAQALLRAQQNDLSECQAEKEVLIRQTEFMAEELFKQEMLSYELPKIEKPVQESTQEVYKKPTRTARITMYSPHDDRNGINSEGDPNITATGMQSGPTVAAVDPEKIPYGTRFKIEGFDRTFIAGDTGSALRNYDGVAIDVYTESFDDAMEFGVQYREVKIEEVE